MQKFYSTNRGKVLRMQRANAKNWTQLYRINCNTEVMYWVLNEWYLWDYFFRSPSNWLIMSLNWFCMDNCLTNIGFLYLYCIHFVHYIHWLTENAIKMGYFNNSEKMFLNTTIICGRFSWWWYDKWRETNNMILLITYFKSIMIYLSLNSC